MSAYLKNPARPILSVASATALRAEPSALLVGGAIAFFSVVGAGASFLDLAQFDETSVAADDGVAVFKPDDVEADDPGRWVIFGSEDVEGTYVRRKADGSIDGTTTTTTNFLTDSSSVVNANDRPIQALPNTLDFLRDAGIPATFAHRAAAGSSQEVLSFIREITAAGAGTVGTAAEVGWYTRNNAGTPALALMGSERVELTAVSGPDLSGKRVWSTVNAGAEADKLTLFADGTFRLHALAGSGTQVIGIANTGDVTITGVGTTTLTTIVGAKVLENETVPSFTNGVPIKNLSSMLDFVSAVGTTARFMRATADADDLYEVLQVTLNGTSTSDIGNGPKIGFYGANADVSPALLASFGARATSLSTDVESGELVFIARTSGVEGVIGWWGSDGLHVATDLIVSDFTTGFVRSDASGVLSSSALSSGDVTTALGYTPVTNARQVIAGAGMTGGGALSADVTLDVAAADASITVNVNSIEASGDFVAKVITTTSRVAAPRFIAAPRVVTSSGGAATFDLSDSQNFEFSISEDATLTITGGTVGQRGVFVFTQSSPAKTITMPTASSTLNYSDALTALGATAMVNTVASMRTVMDYYVMTGGKVIVFGREPITVP